MIALMVTATAVQLVAANIEIDVAAGTASAEYVLVVDSAGFELVAMAAAAELAAAGEPAPWIREGGLYRITATALAGDTTTFDLRYRFPVGADRVPVFVPSVPTDPLRSRLTIRIRGAAPTAGLGDAFPRLSRDADGSLVARPANLPSFVIVPGARGGLYVNRVADLVVVLLLVGATAAWWLRRRAG